jgi:alcohol dehydrogenase class IV
MPEQFHFSRTPDIRFGVGVFDSIADLVPSDARNLLLVTGGSSLKRSGRLDQLNDAFTRKGLVCRHASISGEPSPDAIDRIVSEVSGANIDLVVGVGGGSVVDAGKAVAAMLTTEGKTMDYLEGVGTRRPPGTTKPCIAVPTTAGTGSEATKNAVLSKPGPRGFKKSLRHEAFVPDMAIVDPVLTTTCPPDVTAAGGMDALTQLIEAFVSTGASPLTDSLCRSAVAPLAMNLTTATLTKPDDSTIRAKISYGALISGIALANAGLGVVHGIAAVAGGLFRIPHGVVCAIMLPPATKITIEECIETGRTGALGKYDELGKLLSTMFGDPADRIGLVDTLYRLREDLSVPRLGSFGIRESDIYRIAEATGCKNNAASLSTEAIGTIIRDYL